MTRSRKIAVIGDSVLDEWIHGTLTGCQESCQMLKQERIVTTPGGAANTARQLEHGGDDVYLISPLHPSRITRNDGSDFVDYSLCHGIHSSGIPVKRRFVDQMGRTVFRQDYEMIQYGMTDGEIRLCRDLTVKAVRTFGFDAVVISDYDKGFLDDACIAYIVKACNELNIPCVVDPKRSPDCCQGAIVKCNDQYALKYLDKLCEHTVVVTLGSDYPLIFNPEELREVDSINLIGKHSPCVNHVGAGDCFAAHLTSFLTNGLNLRDSALMAHAAGNVFVKHPHCRPPWPHEIYKERDPVGGKVIQALADLRKSISGRIVFTNGVFRIPHAGHSWLLAWARTLGDVLVVGVNDDNSAHALRNGEYVMPFNERAYLLSSLSSVDWIVPFSETDPCKVIEQLKPDILVKGGEYAGTRVPGDDMIEDVRFAPPSPYPNHAADVVRDIYVQSHSSH